MTGCGRLLPRVILRRSFQSLPEGLVLNSCFVCLSFSGLLKTVPSLASTATFGGKAKVEKVGEVNKRHRADLGEAPGGLCALSSSRSLSLEAHWWGKMATWRLFLMMSSGCRFLSQLCYATMFPVRGGDIPNFKFESRREEFRTGAVVVHQRLALLCSQTFLRVVPPAVSSIVTKMNPKTGR